jgi:hypothetical protein
MVGMLYEKNLFDHIITALNAIPLHELGDDDAVVAILYMKSNMVKLQDAVESAISFPFEIPGPPNGATAAAFLEKERELAAWVLAHRRGIKNDVWLFSRHPDL